MTYSMKVKEEICNRNLSSVEIFAELSAILRYDATLKDNQISLTFENALIARRVYKDFKTLFNISAHITVRDQKRFRSKQVYILDIKENAVSVLERLNILKDGIFLEMNRNYLGDPEEMVAFVQGAFLVIGSLNDPATGGYHLEFVFDQEKDAHFFNMLLHEMKFDTKVLERSGKFIAYLKNSEEISDMIRMFQASNSLFYFEDIRIYRDHKNMVNRLNNCEIANQEKSLQAGMKQIKDILYLQEHDLVDLLDDKTKVIMDYRLKYPESSYQELASIIAMETGYTIGKSGINHHFIKIKKLRETHENKKN